MDAQKAARRIEDIGNMNKWKFAFVELIEIHQPARPQHWRLGKMVQYELNSCQWFNDWHVDADDNDDILSRDGLTQFTTCFEYNVRMTVEAVFVTATEYILSAYLAASDVHPLFQAMNVELITRLHCRDRRLSNVSQSRVFRNHLSAA